MNLSLSNVSLTFNKKETKSKIMKRGLIFFLCLIWISTLQIINSLELNTKNSATLTSFIKKIQTERKVSCIIHVINEEHFKIPEALRQDDTFQFQYLSPGFGIPTPSACSILIVSSSLLDLNPEMVIKMDKSMKNHVWIIDGKYGNDKMLSWPVLEVQPTIVKLHCPGAQGPQLVLASMPHTCPEYPTWNNKVVKVGMIGGHGQLSVLNGKFIGYFPDSISLFNDYIQMQPKFIRKPRSWDEIVNKVHNGTYDIGVHTTPTPQRAQLVDSPSFMDFLEIYYVAPVPKPVDILYQLLTPFSLHVWLAWFVTLATFCVVWYLVAKSSAYQHWESSWIDFPLLSIGLTIQPLLDTQRVQVFRSTKSGSLVIGTLVIAGFLVMFTFYRTVLLSHLTAISFDKPIESVLELAESDVRVLHFQDKRLFETMANSAKPGLKELYEKTVRNGWIIDMRNFTQQGRIYNSGQGGHLLDMQDINWRASQQIKNLNKKLFLRIKDPIITSPRSIVLPKNGPYTATFDKFIVRAYDTGLLHKAKYQYQFRDGKYSKYFSNHLDFSTFFSRCN